MILDQGMILGSTKNRLQSVVSENITKNYFIQLDNRKLRVPIKSYDYSFGYVYPKENVITDEEIEKANYFEIYKYSNDPDVISAASQVLINTQKSMSEVSIDNVKNSVMWGSNLVYPNYFTQKFIGLKNKYNDLPAMAYDGKANIQMGVGSVIMVSHETDGNSAYNGIFNLQSIDDEEVDGKHNLTVKWIRNAAADTWATLTNKVYFIQSGKDEGLRKQVKTNSGETGTINFSPVIFSAEEPVELYTTPQYGGVLTKAPIYKNSKSKVYLRPYSGPKENIKLAYIKPEDAVFNYIDGNVKSDGWYFEPSTEMQEILKPDEVSYKILTFFNNSDENPFYAKASPTLNINSEELYDTSSSLTDYKCVSRVLNVNGEIINRKWMNYKWVLTDLNMGYVQQTDTIYMGNISATFYGLQNNHIYEISLVIEDEFGNVWSTQKIFEVILTIVESDMLFSTTYECETQSVLLDFSAKGIVVPEPSILRYENYLVKIAQDRGTEDANYQLYLVKKNEDSSEATIEYDVLKDVKKVDGYTISYEQGGLILGNVNDELSEDLIPKQLIEYKNQELVSQKVSGELSSPSSDDITLNSQHILNSNFTGTIISYKIETKDVNSLNSYLELNIIVPPIQYYLSKEDKYIENGDRNVLFLQVIKNINGREVWNSNKEISLYALNEDKWVQVEDNRWQKNNEVAFSLVPQGKHMDEPVDYIKTTNAYQHSIGTKQSVTKNRNIFNSYNNDENLMEFPLINAADKQGETYNVWSNNKLEYIQQTSYGDNINVRTNEFNEWKIKNGDNYYYWHTYGNGGAPTYFIDANRNSGRENINKYKFTFNIVIKDYNSKTINNAFILNNIKAKVFKEIV